MEQELKEEWRSFVLDNKIDEEVKGFCEKQSKKGRFNGLDILNFVEKISIKFALRVKDKKA